MFWTCFFVGKGEGGKIFPRGGSVRYAWTDTLDTGKFWEINIPPCSLVFSTFRLKGVNLVISADGLLLLFPAAAVLLLLPAAALLSGLLLMAKSAAASSSSAGHKGDSVVDVIKKI